VRLTLAQSSVFVADWRALRLNDEDLRLLEHQLMAAPDAGAVMAGTGGLRKLRFAPASRSGGKSGGMRVCYLYLPEHELVFLVTVFAKNEKANLAADEKAAFRKLIETIKLGLKR
jgi:hypothetical protein